MSRLSRLQSLEPEPLGDDATQAAGIAVPSRGWLKSPVHFLAGAGIGLSVLAAGGITYILPVGHSRVYPGCALYEKTGIFCTGCGATRAVGALAHGHLLQALAYNPLLVLVMPLLGAVVLHLLVRGITGRLLIRWMPPDWLIVGSAILIIVFTVLRNLPWFAFLAPHTL